MIEATFDVAATVTVAVAIAVSHRAASHGRKVNHIHAWRRYRASKKAVYSIYERWRVRRATNCIV